MDNIKLSTGRILQANLQILGLTPDLRLTDGFDGEFFFGEDIGGEPELTQHEKAEIAAMMIDRWKRWAGIVI